jgi:hypothetical protein
MPLRGVADLLGGRRAYVLEARRRPETVTVDEVPRVVRLESEPLVFPVRPAYLPAGPQHLDTPIRQADQHDSGEDGADPAEHGGKLHGPPKTLESVVS